MLAVPDPWDTATEILVLQRHPSCWRLICSTPCQVCRDTQVEARGRLEAARLAFGLVHMTLLHAIAISTPRHLPRLLGPSRM
jgi:hypothetical protein